MISVKCVETTEQDETSPSLARVTQPPVRIHENYLRVFHMCDLVTFESKCDGVGVCLCRQSNVIKLNSMRKKIIQVFEC